MSSFTPPTQRKEYRLENYRTCEICGDDVDCGVEGMKSHIQSNHSLEEIVQEVSFEWQPNEMQAFQHPSGTLHFCSSVDGSLAITQCGREVMKDEAAPDESTDEWFDRLTYDHSDPDDYCGNCVTLVKRKYGRNALPDPLTDD